MGARLSHFSRALTHQRKAGWFSTHVYSVMQFSVVEPRPEVSLTDTLDTLVTA